MQISDGFKLYTNIWMQCFFTMSQTSNIKNVQKILYIVHCWKILYNFSYKNDPREGIIKKD